MEPAAVRQHSFYVVSLHDAQSLVCGRGKAGAWYREEQRRQEHLIGETSTLQLDLYARPVRHRVCLYIMISKFSTKAMSVHKFTPHHCCEPSTRVRDGS